MIYAKTKDIFNPFYFTVILPILELVTCKVDS